jgi:hypothetical protein
MIPQSMFLETLATVRKRIQQLRDRKEMIGEENTKATLIEPVFAALGWNLQEIDEVRREYKRKPQDNPVDYALFLNRTECLFVEAKSLEKDLSDRKWVSQNLSYATVVGVRWCVLTNGDEYRIYNSHAPVDVDEKLFRTVRLSDSEPKYLTDTLLLLGRDMMRGSMLDELWKAHFIDRNVRAALENILAQPDPGLERLIQKKAAALTLPDIRASLKRAQIRIDFPAPAAASGSVRSELVPGGPAEPAKSRHEAGKKAAETARAMAEATLESLIAFGLIKAPLELEREYKGAHLTAVVEQNGKVMFAGEAYDSLSTAGGMARKQVIGAPLDRPYPQTNGWTFWQYRDDKGDLHEIEVLRKSYLERAQGRQRA